MEKFIGKHFFMGLLVLVFLPGCGCRVIQWGKDWCNQGSNVPNLYGAAACYLRSISVYDQFTTLAMFDALWLSDEVRTMYVNMCAYKTCKTQDQRDTILRRQLAENEHYISFYVISLYEVPLKEKEGVWTISLEVDDACYMPVEVKAVDLSPEYEAIFGKRLTCFKVPYIVRFDAYDTNKCALITSTTKSIKLIFRSVIKECCVEWCLCHSQNCEVPS